METLRRYLGDRWIEPRDAQYERLRRVFNGAIDRRPAGIALCVSEQDVARALEAAHASHLPVSVRASGHNVAGRCVQDGALLIDLRRRNSVKTDARSKTVVVGAGATWGEIDSATQQVGLAVTGGTVPSTGVTGLTLGGGVGWLLPSYGLSCDNLRSARVLSTDGTVYTASDDENPAVIRALRGGGYGLGIVLDLEFDLFPLSQVFGGAEIFSIEDAKPVFAILEDHWASLHSSVMLSPAFLWVRGNPVLELDVAVNGDLSDWKRLADLIHRKCTPLVSTIKRRSYCDMQTLLDNPARRGMGAYWKSGFVNAVSEGVVSALVDAISRSPNDKCLIMVEHYHGRYSEESWTRSAYPYRDKSLNVLIVSNWDTAFAGHAAVARAWARSTFSAISGALTGHDYCNYVSEDGKNRSFDASLEAVRATLDPSNLLVYASIGGTGDDA